MITYRPASSDQSTTSCTRLNHASSIFIVAGSTWPCHETGIRMVRNPASYTVCMSFCDVFTPTQAVSSPIPVDPEIASNVFPRFQPICRFSTKRSASESGIVTSGNASSEMISPGCVTGSVGASVVGAWVGAAVVAAVVSTGFAVVSACVVFAAVVSAAVVSAAVVSAIAAVAGVVSSGVSLPQPANVLMQSTPASITPTVFFIHPVVFVVFFIQTSAVCRILTHSESIHVLLTHLQAV